MKELLEDFYLRQNKTAKEIQKELSIGSKHWRRLKNQYNLEKSSDLQSKAKSKACTKRIISKEQIEDLYLRQNKTSHECQDILSISRGTWKRLVKKYNLQKPEDVIKNNRIEHTIMNLQAKYGSCITNVMQLKKVQQNRLETIYSHNEGRHYASTESWRQKHSATRNKNGTWNTSIFEEEVYQLLIQKFSEVKRQYKSDLYPWHCDFYVPEKQLYIEIQGSAFHGGRIFDPKDDECQNILNKLLKRNNSYSNKVIHNWTNTDVKKRQTAIVNKLNFKEFFTMQEFKDWYNATT